MGVNTYYGTNNARKMHGLPPMAKERQKKAILYQKQGRRSHRGTLVLLRKLAISPSAN